MFKFNKEVRHSIAKQLIKLSWLTSAFSAFVGFTNNSVWALGLVGVWFLALQTMAHILLAYEDSS